MAKKDEAAEVATVEPQATELQFDGETIVKSKKYRQYADLLCIELDEDKLYTESEIDKIIETALARPVVTVINE